MVTKTHPLSVATNYLTLNDVVTDEFVLVNSTLLFAARPCNTKDAGAL